MRITLEALGCRLNDAELEDIAQKLRAAGHEIVKAGSTDSDVIVINSCGVTSAAMRKSRNLARRRLGKAPQILVIMGCAVDLTAVDIGLIPNVDLGKTQLIQIRRDDKDRAAELILEAIQALAQSQIVKVERAQTFYRAHTRRFIKIQDGCNNQCSYCSVRIARGRERNVPMQKILNTVKKCSANGISEIILTGVQLGAWSEGALKLPALIEGILDKTSVQRLRLSSIEPWHLSDALWQLWSRNDRLCPHFHIPIQSGSPEILRAMRRRGDHPAYLEKLAVMRAEIPKLRLSTDIIVGFPGESDRHWQESLEFLRRAKLDDVHLFSFSARPGTAAEKLSQQINNKEKRRRLHETQALVDAIKDEQKKNFVGQSLEVLWESAETETETETDKRLWQGYSENYLRIQRAFAAEMKMRGKVSQVVFGDDPSDLD